MTEFKRAYFGTVLGYLWSLLRPLLLFAILLFVFTKIFRIGSAVESYPVLLLFNIVLFGFFQDATSRRSSRSSPRRASSARLSSRGWSSRSRR